MYLGLDLGTSGIRALLVDADGCVVGEASAPCLVTHLQPGWSEQNPEEWINACRKAMAELRSQHPKEVAAVQAIGLSGHMHGATLIDRNGDVLRPCMLWNDTRADAQARRFDAMPMFRDTTGNIVFPGFTAPKIEWVRENEPDVFAAIHKILLPKDYLRFWLTGESLSDMSDSAGTSWMDVGTRSWSSELLDACQLSEAQMPQLIEGSDQAGELRDQLRTEWGMTGPVIVAGGGGDNAAAACGLGCLSAGDGFVSLGTSGVLLAASDTYAPAPDKAVHSFCHAVPDTWFQMGVTLAATDSLNWLAKVTGSTPAALAGTLPEKPSGTSSALFLPYLSGERTPHNTATPCGVFAGMDISSDQSDLTAAVMEGVAFSLADCLHALRSTGTEISALTTTGGGSKSPFWLQTIANVLDVTLDLPANGEFGAALGAARLAMAADIGGDINSLMSKPEIAKTIEPDASLVSIYQERYAQFRALYPAVTSALLPA